MRSSDQQPLQMLCKLRDLLGDDLFISGEELNDPQFI